MSDSTARIAHFIEDVMAFNEHAAHSMQLIFITPALVQAATHASAEEVAAYFVAHAETLAGHHAEHGFWSRQDGEQHNRLRAMVYREYL